jgi:hypothetical protein
MLTYASRLRFHCAHQKSDRESKGHQGPSTLSGLPISRKGESMRIYRSATRAHASWAALLRPMGIPAQRTFPMQHLYGYYHVVYV